jgi:hypothetical protein
VFRAPHNPAVAWCGPCRPATGKATPLGSRPSRRLSRRACGPRQSRTARSSSAPVTPLRGNGRTRSPCAKADIPGPPPPEKFQTNPPPAGSGTRTPRLVRTRSLQAGPAGSRPTPTGAAHALFTQTTEPKPPALVSCSCPAEFSKLPPLRPPTHCHGLASVATGDAWPPPPPPP